MHLIIMQRKQTIDMDQYNYLALLKIKTSLVITHFFTTKQYFLLVHHLNENITS